MKNLYENYSENKKAALTAAKNEGRILPRELLQEIEPLLREYFLGEFSITENSLKMSFENGQHFNLTVGEVI